MGLKTFGAGKLLGVPEEPYDKPAEKLLERIRFSYKRS